MSVKKFKLIFKCIKLSGVEGKKSLFENYRIIVENYRTNVRKSHHQSLYITDKSNYPITQHIPNCIDRTQGNKQYESTLWIVNKAINNRWAKQRTQRQNNSGAYPRGGRSGWSPLPPLGLIKKKINGNAT